MNQITRKVMNEYITSTNRFVIFCNEMFTFRTTLPSEEVYKILSEKGVIKELIDGYEDLHGMSTPFLNQYISKLSGIKLCKQHKADHSLGKFIIFVDVVEMIAKDDGITLDEARDRFYNSYIASCFADDEFGFYGDSPPYIYSLYRNELEKGITQ